MINKVPKYNYCRYCNKQFIQRNVKKKFGVDSIIYQLNFCSERCLDWYLGNERPLAEGEVFIDDGGDDEDENE